MMHDIDGQAMQMHAAWRVEWCGNAYVTYVRTLAGLLTGRLLTLDLDMPFGETMGSGRWVSWSVSKARGSLGPSYVDAND